MDSLTKSRLVPESPVKWKEIKNFVSQTIDGQLFSFQPIPRDHIDDDLIFHVFEKYPSNFYICHCDPFSTNTVPYVGRLLCWGQYQVP